MWPGLAEEVDTYGKEQTFPATGIDGGVKVTQSNYGWKIDQEQETAQLAQDIADHLTTTREPVYSSREFSSDNNGFGIHMWRLTSAVSMYGFTRMAPELWTANVLPEKW